MQVSPSQIRAKLAECEALRDDALDTVRRLALSRLDAPASERQSLVSKFDGYEREFWALMKIERELISSGKAESQMPSLTESRFNAPAPLAAVPALQEDSDASSAIRGASRGPVLNPVSEKTGPVLAVPSPGGPPPANLPAWSAGDGF
jgi:hypothetical protein